MKKKYRVNTTISEKHHEILKECAAKYGTQQKVLEHALENLENNSYQNQAISTEEQQWLRLYREVRGILTILPKDLTRVLFETAEIEQFKEYIENVKQMEGALEYFYGKPLKEFSLQEIIEGIILNIKLQGSADTVNYTEENDYFKINLTHRMGIFDSKAVVVMYGSVFDSYGVKYETHFTERTVFFKIYK